MTDGIDWIAWINRCAATQRAETKASGVREYLEGEMALKKKKKSKMPTPGPWMPGPEHTSSSPLEPHSAIDWQRAVNSAHFLLLIDAARAYGLVTGGPEINAGRCAEIIRRGKAMGVKPNQI